MTSIGVNNSVPQKQRCLRLRRNHTKWAMAAQRFLKSGRDKTNPRLRAECLSGGTIQKQIFVTGICSARLLQLLTYLLVGTCLITLSQQIHPGQDKTTQYWQWQSLEFGPHFLRLMIVDPIRGHFYRAALYGRGLSYEHLSVRPSVCQTREL